MANVAGPDERKIATVVFADLVGSTEWGAQDPERARVHLESFYEAMREEIQAHGGTVEKFIGDAVMAVFGAPAALEDHPSRALRAGVAMQQRMATLFDGRLGLRVGVNSGEVVVGQPREGSSFVTGDPVNVAARLEQAASPGDILVGERTVSMADEEFEFAPLTTIPAKGKPDGVPARRLLRAGGRRFRARAQHPRHREFVGRDAELAGLRTAYLDALHSGQPKHVTVIGEPGVGKTTLVQELLVAVSDVSASERRPILRTGRCLAYGRGITYWPFGEILRQQFGVAEEDPPEQLVERLGVYGVLAATLGVAGAEDLHPFAAKERLHQTWVGLVNAMTDECPVVLWVEDVHWAEDLLFELVDRLVAEVTGPLLVVTTARPELAELHPSWVSGYGRTDRTLLSLQALRDADARDLLSLLTATDVSDDLHLSMLERAEGNPFFLEEIVQSFLDADHASGPREHSELPHSFIPDSVQALLAARIDALPEDVKPALQVAAVVGRVFWGSLVAELLSVGHAELRTLEERGFIRSHGGSALSGEREYSFKHALSRQVAYESISKVRRARLHSAVAEWMERNDVGRVDQAPLIAYHYAEAASPADADLAWRGEEQQYESLKVKAVHWLRLAAQQAASQYSLGDAIELLERALDLEPPSSVRAAILTQLGHLHALKYDGMACWQALERALELTDDPSARAAIYSELAMQTVTRYAMLNPMPARELVDDWIEQALASAAPGSLARAEALAARAMWFAADPTTAAEDAYAAALELDDVTVLDQACNALALAAFNEGRYDDALGWARRRLELMDAISDPDVVVDILSAMIPGLLGLGRFDDAMSYATRHDVAASELSAHHRVHAVAMRLEVHELAAAWPMMAGLGERTRRAVDVNQATPCLRNARSLLSVAVGLQLSDDARAAREFEAAAVDVAMAGYDGSVAPLQIMLALARDDLGTVQRLLPTAVPPPPAKNWWRLVTIATRLDALTQLRTEEQLREEAAAVLVPGTYLGAFAARSLALLDHDEAGTYAAAAAFRAMGLHWHSAQTVTAVGSWRLRW